MSTPGPIPALYPEQLTRLEQLDSTHPAKEKNSARFSGKEVKVVLLTSLPFVLAGLLTLLTSFFLPLGLAFGLATAGYFTAGTIASAAIFNKLLSDRKAEAIPAEYVYPFINPPPLKSTIGNISDIGPSRQRHGSPASGHNSRSDQSLNPTPAGVLPGKPASRVNTDDNLENSASAGKIPVTPDASKDNTEHLTENADLATRSQRKKEKAFAKKLTNELFKSLRDQYAPNQTAATSLENCDSAVGESASSTQSEQNYSSEGGSSGSEDDNDIDSANLSVNPRTTGPFTLQRDLGQPPAPGKTSLQNWKIYPIREFDIRSEPSSLSSDATIDDGFVDLKKGTGPEANEPEPIAGTATTRQEQLSEVAAASAEPEEAFNVTVKKQSEHKTALGIGEKENKTIYQSTDIPTNPMDYQCAEQSVSSAALYDLTDRPGKTAPKSGNTSTALVRMPVKPVDTIHRDLSPSAARITRYFRGIPKISAGKLQLRLIPDNTGPLTSDNLAPDSRNKSDDWLKIETFDLHIDKSKFPALHFKQFAREGDKAVDKLEKFMKIDAPARKSLPAEKALPAPGLSMISTGQQPSGTEKLFQEAFGGIKKKPAKTIASEAIDGSVIYPERNKTDDCPLRVDIKHLLPDSRDYRDFHKPNNPSVQLALWVNGYMTLPKWKSSPALKDLPNKGNPLMSTLSDDTYLTPFLAKSRPLTPILKSDHGTDDQTTFETENNSFEIVNIKDLLKQCYEESTLLSAINGLSDNKKIQKKLAEDKAILLTPALTGSALREQLCRDTKGIVLDVRLQQRDGSTEEISHRNLADFADAPLDIDDKASQIVEILYSKVDAFLTSGLVQDESRRNNLKEIMLNYSHQGAFSIHCDIESLIMDTYIETLKGQLGTNTNTRLPSLYNFNETIHLGDTYAEQDAAYTIKPELSKKCTWVEFKVDENNQNLMIKTVSECSFEFIKHSNQARVSDSPKKLAIATHYTLGLHPGTQNRFERITAVELTDYDKGSTPQHHPEPVVLFSDE